MDCLKMTPDNGRNWSNNSNSADNQRAEDLPKVFLITYAVIHFLFFLFCLFIVLYLSVRLKKRAWDSPAKRFANIFNVCFALFALCIGVKSFGVLHEIALFGVFLLFLADNLYFIAMYVALSLKVVTLFLPEKLKLYAHKTHYVTFTEIASHVLFLLLAISYSVSHIKLDVSRSCIIYVIIIGVVFIVFLLSYSFLFLASVFLMKFFKYHNNKKKGVKYMIIKLIFLLIVFIIYATLVVLLNLTLPFWSLLFVILLHCVFYFILSISVVSLNHPLDIWCCQCHFRRSPPSGVSMIVNNDTEEQQTNPVSVWDHRNVPSCTVTNLPYDMSDCRSDYEQYS